MTLARYQIRNEYGLADKELYQSSDKEDAETLLEGSSMAGLVGLLRQLGDLAEFAGEVFHNLHEELMTTSARGKGLAIPYSRLLILILDSRHWIDRSCTVSGFEWHSTLQTDENLISPSKFDVDGSGACLKRYSDPSLLKTLTASEVLGTSKLSKNERPSKTKKKVSHTSNEERLGDSQTSHSKLHQLFLEEHVEKGDKDPEFHARLKRRGPPINSSSGTGYMEKFLKNSLPYCDRVHETLDQSSSATETEVTVRVDLSTPSLVSPSNGDTRKEREMESIADDERVKRPYVEGGPVICLERSSSVNNGTDGPVSTETEAKEADGDEKAGGNIRQIQMCANADVTQTEDMTQRESTQVVVDASEGGTSSLQTDDAEDYHYQHVLGVETESEMSLTGLVEDQFSSLTNQETEEESDCLLIQNHHIRTFENFEDVSLDVVAVHDSAVAKEDETNSQDRSSKNTEHSGHISTFEISSQNDIPRDLHTGTMNLLGSSWQDDALVNSDVAEISSDCGQVDPQNKIADGSSELEVPIPDTQKNGTVFAGDKKTSLNDKASETMPEVVGLENISDTQESLLGIQECLSPEYHVETHGQGEESPPETESENPSSAAAVEPLPPQDVPLGVQCSPSEELEAPSAPQQGTITSLHGNISESVLPMNPTDQENCLDVPMSLFSTSLHEIPEEDLEITPPLPPLPPTQWWMGKLVESVKATESQCSPVPSLECNSNSSFYIHRKENTHDGLVQATKPQDQSEASVTAGENHNSHEQTALNEPSKAAKEEQSPSESVAWVSLLTTEATPEAEATEGLEALEWFSQNFKKQTNHNLANLEKEPQLDHPLEPPGETERDNNLYEENEKVEKLPRNKGSFVIGIDKSMLRKVSERNRTQLGAPVEEKDSLLEIIRSKQSFNLRPADASLRHSFQVAVPTTNLKVAAILEKANSLRHVSLSLPLSFSGVIWKFIIAGVSE
ncbi:hypothetical protein Bca101_012857 [Brassica carinata]